MSTTPNLVAASEKNLAVLIDTDAVIRQFLAKIERHKKNIKDERANIAIALGAIRRRKAYLKQENGDFIRKLTGVQVVPGMLPPRLTRHQQQQAIRAEYEAEVMKAQAALAEEKAAETSPPETEQS